MRASVDASSASVNAVSSSYLSRSTTDTLRLDRTRREATAARGGADLAAVVVAGRLHLVRADRPLFDRVEEHEVRVLADGDLTLRAQAGEPCGRRREDV